MRASTLPSRVSVCGYNVASGYKIGLALFVAILCATVLGVTILLSNELMLALSYGELYAYTGMLLVLVPITEALLFLVMVADPGFVVPDDSNEAVHSCPVCKLDVEEFDHHCGVLGACIGRGNMQYFVTFNIFATIISALGLYITAYYTFLVLKSSGVFVALWHNWISVPQLLIKQVLCCPMHLAGLVLCVACVYATSFCLGLACIYSYYCLVGLHSHRRRQGRVMKRGRVFHNFFSPRFSSEVLLHLEAAMLPV